MPVQEVSRDALDQGQLLQVLTAFEKGDFTVRMPVELTGVAGKIADTLNEILERQQELVKEFEQVSIAVGKEGHVSQRASLQGATGGWAACIESINTLIGDLVQPTNEMARVIGAVAKGDLSQAMAFEIEGRPLKGQFLQTAKVVNSMVGQLGSFAEEVTRVAREVGTDGKLGGQAAEPGVAGTWQVPYATVIRTPTNLAVARLIGAVATGALAQAVAFEIERRQLSGQFLQTAKVVNSMVGQLGSFAEEVTRVAREVGTDGKLG